MTPDKDYDNRLSRVEAVVEGLADELGKLTKAVQTISDRTRPQWGNYMAAASVLLLIIGMVGSGYIRDMKRIEGNVEMLSKTSLTQSYESGRRQVQIEDAIEGIKDLDIILQREMGLLIETLVATMEALDKRLQNEMRLLNKAQDVRSSDLYLDVERIFDWQEDHDKRVAPLNGQQWERIKALEREVYGHEVSGGKGTR